MTTSRANSEIVTVGAPVDAKPARRPHRIALEGSAVRVVPLDPVVHGDALFDGTHDETKEQLCLYLFDGPFATRAAFNFYLREKATSEDPLFFAILDKASGDAVGHAAYCASSQRIA